MYNKDQITKIIETLTTTSDEELKSIYNFHQVHLQLAHEEINRRKLPRVSVAGQSREKALAQEKISLSHGKDLNCECLNCTRAN